MRTKFTKNQIKKQLSSEPKKFLERAEKLKKSLNFVKIKIKGFSKQAKDKLNNYYTVGDIIYFGQEVRNLIEYDFFTFKKFKEALIGLDAAVVIAHKTFPSIYIHPVAIANAQNPNIFFTHLGNEEFYRTDDKEEEELAQGFGPSGIRE